MHPHSSYSATSLGPIYHAPPWPSNLCSPAGKWYPRKPGPSVTRAPCPTRTFGEERHSVRGDKFNRHLGRKHCPVYWWETVCWSKSSLGTFEDVWQAPVPKAAVCYERARGPQKTQQPEGYLPRSLLRQQYGKVPIQEAWNNYYVFKRCPFSRISQSLHFPPCNCSFRAICTHGINYLSIFTVHKLQTCLCALAQCKTHDENVLTTMRYPFNPIRSEETENNKYLWRCKDVGTLVHSRG